MDERRRMKMRIVKAVEERAPVWKEIALRIHAHPEVGREEVRAAAWLAGALEEAGFDVRRGAGMPTAFLASKETVRHAPVVAFCAEYDALPGLGHACGHNLIGAAACLAADALSRTAPCRVRVVGCPAEEGFGGKVELLNRGVFDGIQFAMMCHGGPRTLPHREMMGRIGYTFDFRGKGSLAVSAPDKGQNALDAAVLAYQAIGLLRQQVRDRCRIQAIIPKGGELLGRIPDFAQVQVAVRCREMNYLEELGERVVDCAKGAARAAGVRLAVSRPFHPMLPMRGNAALEEAYADNLRFIGIEPQEWPDDAPIGSTDFGNVSQVIPSIHPYFKMVPEGVDHHTRKYAEASRSEAGLAGMVCAAKAMALTGYDLTADAALRRKVRRAFAACEEAEKTRRAR